MVPRDLLVQQALWENEVIQGHLGLQVIKDYQVLLERREQREILVLLVNLEKMALRV